MSSMSISRLTRSPSRVFIVILIVLVTFQLLSIRSNPTATPSSTYKSNTYKQCEGLEALDDVFVTLRTGTTEAPKKLPAHYTTTLRCLPHYELFSDFEEVIQGHQVYDVLDEVDPEIIAKHPDFEYYNRLRGKGRDAFTAQEMDQWASAKNTNTGRDSPGWKLDKWKFLPLADKALKLRPQAKWFVFIESDTYVLWKSLVAWLDHFDASKPWYLGREMQIGDVIFAYGGAGFAISQPALKKVVEHRNANLKFYDELTANHWAGDCVLGKALHDVGVPLTWSFPTLSGEEPAEFESGFGGPDMKKWCSYAASYHHLPPSEYPVMYDFEQKWYQTNKTLLRHKDVLLNYLLPQIATERADWDNHSDKEQNTESSFKDCQKTCESDPACMQFSISGKTCKTSTALKLGNEVSAESKVTSGWILDHVDAFVKQLESKCEGGDWVLQE